MSEFSFRTLVLVIVVGLLATSLALGDEPAGAAAGFRFEATSDASLALGRRQARARL